MNINIYNIFNVPDRSGSESPNCVLLLIDDPIMISCEYTITLWCLIGTLCLLLNEKKKNLCSHNFWLQLKAES